MPRGEGMSETGQIVVAILSTVTIAALTKWGLFPDEDGSKGDGGGGGGGSGGQIIFHGGTHTHYSGGVPAVEGVEEHLDRILEQAEETGGPVPDDVRQNNIGRLIIQNRGNDQTILPFTDAFMQQTGGQSFVVVLSNQWEDNRHIDVAYYNQDHTWHMGETVHMGGHNGCQHWLATVGPGTFLRILTNRDEHHTGLPVNHEIALRYLSRIIPSDGDTYLPYDRKLNYFEKTTGHRRGSAQYTLDEIYAPTMARPTMTLAVFCPKRTETVSP